MESSSAFFLLCGIIAILLLILWAKPIFKLVVKIVAGGAALLIVALLLSALIRVDLLGMAARLVSELSNPPSDTMLVHTNGHVRACPRTSCSVVGGLKAGDPLQSQGAVDGDPVDGNDQWIEFEFKGAKAYVWSGLLRARATPMPRSTATRPADAATAPAATEPAAPNNTEGPMWSPRMCSYVYNSPISPAVAIGRVNASDTIQELDRVEYRVENRAIAFVKFMHNGAVGYIDEGRLSPAHPPYLPTKTPLAFECDCSKPCDGMTCAEAFFQLVQCGCGQRDSDNNGIPCNTRCGCSQY